MGRRWALRQDLESATPLLAHGAPSAHCTGYAKSHSSSRVCFRCTVLWSTWRSADATLCLLWALGYVLPFSRRCFVPSPGRRAVALQIPADIVYPYGTITVYRSAPGLAVGLPLTRRSCLQHVSSPYIGSAPSPIHGFPSGALCVSCPSYHLLDLRWFCAVLCITPTHMTWRHDDILCRFYIRHTLRTTVFTNYRRLWRFDKGRRGPRHLHCLSTVAGHP